MLIHVPNTNLLRVITRSNSIKSFVEFQNMILLGSPDESGVNLLPNYTCDTGFRFMKCEIHFFPYVSVSPVMASIRVAISLVLVCDGA